MSWIVNNWRLKLLAVVLAMGLLAAVAFSENPPVLKTVPVGVQYKLPPGLVIVNPPRKVPISVIGLSDAVNKVGASSVGVTVDLTKAHPGPNQTYSAKPTIAVPGVSAQSDSVPLILNIEELRSVPLEVEVRTAQPAPGIKIATDKTLATCGNSAQKCQVTVTAPASVVDGLTAYVNYDQPITSSGVVESPSQPIKFEQKGRAIDFSKLDTDPDPGVTPATANVHIEATGGTLAKTVGLHANIAGSPACGYVVGGVTISNPFPLISGPADAVTKLGDAIELPQISIAGATGSISQNVTINLPDSALSASPGRVTVTVAVNPSVPCTPVTPTPVPSPTPPR